MAYTIISQNNTTTTLSDENGNVITVPARVTLATSTDYTIIKVNNNSVDLESGDGKIIRGVPACVVLAGEGGGGGSVDYSKTVQKTNSMPVASADNAGQVYLYTGATDANYTQNYIYKNVKSATYTGTVSIDAAGISSTLISCSGADFAAFLGAEMGVDPVSVVQGAMSFDASSNLWTLVGRDSDGEVVGTIREYQQDYEDAGFTFSGTPVDGDNASFVCSIEEVSATYSWQQIDVQPSSGGLPDQTGNAGKFLTTDGTDTSWSDKPLVNQTTSANSVAIALTNTTQASSIGASCVAIGSPDFNVRGDFSIKVGAGGRMAGSNNTFVGYGAGNQAAGQVHYSVCFGSNARVGATSSRTGCVAVGARTLSFEKYCITLGYNAAALATGAIQIGHYEDPNNPDARTENSDANTFKVANANGNFELMDANGNLPADRLASTTGLADGNYRLRLVMASGVPMLEWVAE